MAKVAVQFSADTFVLKIASFAKRQNDRYATFMNLDILNIEYKLTNEQIQFYEENRFIKLKNVLTPEIIRYFNTEISKKVNQLNTNKIPFEQRNTYRKAFLQLFNLWREDNNIELLVLSKRLAQIACELMQVSGVRLYHDQSLFKEAGGGITPWHADQHYWPLSSDKTITAWIPLQKTPLNPILHIK